MKVNLCIILAFASLVLRSPFDVMPVISLERALESRGRPSAGFAQLFILRAEFADLGYRSSLRGDGAHGNVSASRRELAVLQAPRAQTREARVFLSMDVSGHPLVAQFSSSQPT